MAPLHSDFFDAYNQAFDRWIRVDPGHRGATMVLSDHPAPEQDGPAHLRTLFDIMGAAPWEVPGSGRSHSNWTWRIPTDKTVKATGEVALERLVVARDRHKDWSYQMSTCSGLREGRKDRRRAIDLVQRVDDQTWRFIELKTRSDTPLYAIREILGYGLAYLHTRRLLTPPLPGSPWMSTPNLRLAVLAPTPWYLDATGQVRDGLALRWLQTSINAGLQALTMDGWPSIELELLAFEPGGTTEATADAIRRGDFRPVLAGFVPPATASASSAPPASAAHP